MHDENSQDTTTTHRQTRNKNISGTEKKQKIRPVRLPMRVVFYKAEGGRCCAWKAFPPKRKGFQGTTMAAGRDLPHDLAQFVVESTLGLPHGFWGLVARGASFESMPGRRRTRPGREVIRAHAPELVATENLVNAQVTAWRAGAGNQVASALDEMLARWQALREGEELSVDWAMPAERRQGERRPR
jgi:hypothetical protein